MHRQFSIFSFTALSLLLFVGCKSELDDKKEATVGAVTELRLQTTGLREVPFTTGGKLEWYGAKVTGDHTGGFEKWDGKVYFDASGQVKAVRVDVDTTSVFSDSERLTRHLKSPDFFDVQQFPSATFIAENISTKPDGKFTHEARGKLQLRGVTREITFPLTVRQEGKKASASSEFTIKRFDFNITYKGKANDLIKDEVLIRFDVSAPAP